MSAIPAFGKKREEDDEIEGSLGYTISHSFKEKKAGAKG